MTSPTSRPIASAPTTVQFEIYDFTEGGFDYAVTFERAVRIMRRYVDAKITRIGDGVVLAQTIAE